MSLIVWLPLNGDSHNQGLKKYTETTNTLSYAINGKVTEKCADKGKLVYNKNPLQMVGTICFWLYPKSAAEGNDGKSSIIFGNTTFNDSARKWSLYMFPDNKSLHSWGCQKEGSTTFNGSFTYNNVLKESTWNHICVAHDLKNEYIYVNSNLIGTVPWDSSGTYNFDKETDIIRDETWETGTNNFKINDFRIYDHCLTQSEVSEIAKGLMLHYSFENPYAEETVNIPHSLVNTAYVSLGSDDTGNYFIKNSGGQGWNGLSLQYVPATGGNYYTWSLEVNPTVDLYIENQIEIIDSYVDTNLPIGSHCYFDRNLQPTSTWEGNDKGAIITSTFQGNLPKNTWTKVWFTVYVVPEVGSTKLFHHFCPQIPTGDTSLKIYYRNSLFEEKNHPTPYTSSSREAGLIRDNSGMGNDGTQVYQREEIPITINPTAASGLSINYNSELFTITGFNGNDNQCVTLGTIKYNSRYHYLNSLVSYEFDITFKDLVMTDGKTLSDYNTSSFTDTPTQVQGQIYYNDGTNAWTKNEPVRCQIAKRLNDGKTANGTFHICYENTITDSSIVTNINYYEFGIRFNYVKSGTITISNLHAYYQSLDTSTLSLSDNSAVGTHSAYFNGKNYIDCGVVTPDYMDELTLSCWVYRDDWSINMNNSLCPSIVGKIDSGGFGFKLEKVSNYNGINFPVYYKDTGYAGNVTGVTNIGFDYKNLSPGWHLFTGIANKNKYATYIDGELLEEQIHNINKPISTVINPKKQQFNLYIGTEVNGDYFTNLENVYVDDVRLYSTALSDEDIKALYNVKTKIDNKSNLYCNQLIETKQENLASDLSKITDFGVLGCNCNINYDTNNRILTFTLTSNSKNSYVGPYILNKYYGGQLITNKTYRYSIYVKFSKSGTWKVGEERIINSLSSPFKNGQEYEAGKWYKIENEGVATAAQVNFIFYYCSGLLEAGDKIEIRDFQMYRLYDNENYNPGPNIKGQYKTFELNETLTNNPNAKIVNKYNARWLQVFHHNTNNNTVWFKNAAEALHCNTTYKFSILDQLEYFRNKDGNFEFLLEYPIELPNKYNRWIQSDNPATTTEGDTPNGSPATGYTAIHVDWTDHLWGGLLKGYYTSKFCFIDGTTNHGNCYYAIGCYDNTNNTECIEEWRTHMPGPVSPVTEVNLYVRIDDNDNFKIYNRNTKANEIIEI